MKVKLTLAIMCNLTMGVWMAFCLAHDFSRGGDGNMRVAGVRFFRYFTVDSNILVSLAALMCIPFEIRVLSGAADSLPTWMNVLKYAGTAAVSLTMLTVLFFLGPTQGYGKMMAGDNLYMHLLGPLLAILTFCLLEDGAALRFSDTFFAVLPTMIYGAVYMLLVVVKEAWPDFYGFNGGGRWPLSMAAMLLGSWGICLLLRLLHNL